MSVIDHLFQQLREQNRKALMPFVTAGDPSLDMTAAVLRELVARGAHLCELGIPYSDPIADGPVIQASYTRALAKNLQLADILGMLSSVTPDLTAPVVAMNSFAIVHRHGAEEYVDMAAEAGVVGMIVPDLPAEESDDLARICRERDFSLIQLISPTTPRERAVRIAEKSSGFIYYISVTGITGERSDLPAQLSEDVTWLRARTPLPICIGFGISSAAHVRQLAPIADGFIVGSALVRRIANATTTSQQEVLDDVGEFVASLLAATS